jgi:hypothetical protein
VKSLSRLQGYENEGRKEFGLEFFLKECSGGHIQGHKVRDIQYDGNIITDDNFIMIYEKQVV